jgi:conjugal transfer pilus assembly protein TraV
VCSTSNSEEKGIVGRSFAIFRGLVAVGGAAVAVMLVGCSLNPYHSEFMCAATANHGKCESVDQAYGEALEQDDGPAQKESMARPAAPTGKPAKAKSAPPPAELMPVSNSPAEDTYRQAQYRKLAALVEQPVMPIVQPAKTMRTLILPYPAGDSLYMPRFVFWIAEQPKFVIGEYLNPPSTAQTVYPNGGP